MEQPDHCDSDHYGAVPGSSGINVDVLEEGLNDRCDAIAVVQAKFFKEANMFASRKRGRKRLNSRNIVRKKGGRVLYWRQ